MKEKEIDLSDANKTKIGINFMEDKIEMSN